ncbi:kinesin-domain-containing protein, partial [Coemansia reversa NRRL 1564]
MSGFNGTIFAYGQTSSGKTHTMYGSGSELGIIKLAVKNMFDMVNSDTNREYLLRVSFLEIYNEVLRDLLEPTKSNLKIHENSKHEIFVGDLSEHIVFNAAQVEEVLQKGDRNRHIAGTNMNERSSRSHTIFRIVIESREKAFTGAVKVSCLNLVDLAGSERVGQTGAEGQRLKEGAHINKSLLALGTVIGRLSEDGGDRGHVPYRDSKLTRILQPSLGGNAKTLIICTITPSPDYADETLSTLKFASRAKTIRNTPEVNE